MPLAKVIYFIAGTEPTPDEQTAINAILNAQIYVAIRTDLKPAMYGITAEECNYVAGSVPASHTAKPVWPGAVLSPVQAIVSDEQSFVTLANINDSADVSFTVIPTVVDGVITGLKLNEVV